MKEFVEKLKSRLEERRNEENNNSLCEMNENGHTLDFECSVGKTNAFNESISIVNELVEEYNNGWIPCSERLPEGNDDVMVIYTDNDGEVDICCLDWFLSYSDTMLAWMPLPQPYKPQKLEWKDKVMKRFTNVE